MKSPRKPYIAAVRCGRVKYVCVPSVMMFTCVGSRNAPLPGYTGVMAYSSPPGFSTRQVSFISSMNGNRVPWPSAVPSTRGTCSKKS